MVKSYDLVILGAGPGGYVAGLYAASHNLCVCVIEKDSVGGTCLNRGCIPTKAMLYSASILSKIKESGEYGIDVERFAINFPKIISRKDAVVERLRAGIETLFRAHKIDLIRGAAEIVGPSTVRVNGSDIEARSIIIATGSRPLAIPGMPCDEMDICSSDGILALRDLPKSIVIIGGGVIGCEFATLFNAFGTRVTIVELLDRILPTQSREVSKKLELVLKKRGVGIQTSSNVEAITKGDAVRVRLANAETIDAEKVLISVGRHANIEGLGLETVGIKTDNGKIAVDEFLKTSAGNIYAIGDCIGGMLLAHKASYEGILACDNILGKKRGVEYSAVPQCVYSDPEIASVGLSEEEARKKCAGTKIAKFPYLGSGKAYLMGKSEGFIKIVGDEKGKILGIEIFGEGACDLIGEATVALAGGLTVQELSRVVHAHPTLSEIFQEAAHVFCGTPIHGV